MKLIIAALAIAGIILLLRLSVSWFGPAKPSHSSEQDVKDNGGLLLPCPSTPNCYITQIVVVPASAESTQRNGVTDDSIVKDITIAVTAGKGRIETLTDNYLHATFKSRLFGFIDDFECLVVKDKQRTNGDHESTVLHCKSASRIGHSDLGVNKKRVAAILQSAGIRLPD